MDTKNNTSFISKIFWIFQILYKFIYFPCLIPKSLDDAAQSADDAAEIESSQLHNQLIQLMETNLEEKERPILFQKTFFFGSVFLVFS